MANQYVITTGSVTLVALTSKTIIEIPTGSTAPFTIIGMELMSAPTAAGSITLEYGTYVTTGTGTTVTPLRLGIDQSIAANLGTVKVANSVEPTPFTPILSWLIPLPGMYSILYPYGREPYQPISTLRAFRVNSTQASPCRMNLYIEQ